MSRKLDMIGKRFGKLTVIEEYDRNKRGYYRYLCKCDCGNEKIAIGSELQNGHIKSCGCYKKDSIINRCAKYTKEEKKLYGIWKGIRSRCNNKNSKPYQYYGGRGITICDEWNDYLIFYHWSMQNGYEKGKQLDRINNDGNYEPSNCRWVTPLENNHNRGNVNHYTINGITHTLTEWCSIYKIKYNTVRARIIQKGWDIEKALTTPLLKGKNKQK